MGAEVGAEVGAGAGRGVGAGGAAGERVTNASRSVGPGGEGDDAGAVVEVQRSVVPVGAAAAAAAAAAAIGSWIIWPARAACSIGRSVGLALEAAVVARRPRGARAGAEPELRVDGPVPGGKANEMGGLQRWSVAKVDFLGPRITPTGGIVRTSDVDGINQLRELDSNLVRNRLERRDERTDRGSIGATRGVGPVALARLGLVVEKVAVEVMGDIVAHKKGRHVGIRVVAGIGLEKVWKAGAGSGKVKGDGAAIAVLWLVVDDGECQALVFRRSLADLLLDDEELGDSRELDARVGARACSQPPAASSAGGTDHKHDREFERHTSSPPHTPHTHTLPLVDDHVPNGMLYW